MKQAFGRILRASGYSPVLFSSAEAALEAEPATAADCLILDIHLPGMSGFELYRQLAPTGARSPAIFITAHDEPAVREEAQRLGGAYFSKPFSGRALLDAITQALSSD
jgi:FixJ family two-component response regulator